MIIVFSPRADQDLRDIFDFIARDGTVRAQSFVEELSQAAFSLEAFPLAWPLIPRYEAKGFRRKTCKGHLIFFEVVGETVTILRILNGVQEYERLRFPKDEIR